MSRVSNTLRAALAIGAAASIAACTSDEASRQVLGPRLTEEASIFQSYVSLGNSITAGYQSGGINDSTQRRAYPVLLASQIQTRFAYPSLAGRGCAPPISNFLTQARVGSGTSSTCDLRNPSTSEILNNVAVPGATVADLTAPQGTSASNTLTTLFLGGKSQVQKALEARPTFASIWIGNNDVLVPAISGVLVPMAKVSPGITPTATFTAKYDEALAQLTAGAPGLKGVLISVAQTGNIPLLFPVAVLQSSAAFKGGFDQAAGYNAASTDFWKSRELTIDRNCDAAGTTTLLSFTLASAIAKFRNDTNATGQPPKDPALRIQAGGMPPHIACGVATAATPSVPGTPWPAPVGDIGILTLTERTALADSVNKYNDYIKTKAAALGWAYWDVNQLFDSVKTAGGVPTAPNLASGTATFGAWFSLDGVHPSSQAHRAFMNHVADSVNAKYNTSIPKVSVP